jgi:hypothetical protein
MQLTLDLRDNPFDPQLADGVRLSGEPLMVDANPDLMKLVCWKIAELQDREEDLRFALFGDYRAADAPVQRNIILLILGVRGSGRSTLASLLCKRVLAAKQPGDAWQKFELVFDKYQPNIDPNEVAAQFTKLRGEVKGKFADRAGRALVLIDDLPKLSFEHVMSAFGAFPRLSRVFVVASDDLSLLERDLDAAGPIIERVTLPKLTAQDVRTFIQDRVPDYRGGRIPLLATEAELALFPFAPTAPETAVNGDRKPLQSVRVWLWKRIEERHRKLLAQPGLKDVAQADLQELRERMIP